MKHATVSAGHATYDDAFAVAVGIVHTARKESWRGRVRIKYRKRTQTFDVQVPA
jgi:long-subunit fatty acid transport protein